MRPPSIVWFERLFLLSLLIASIAMVTSFDTLVAQVEADPALAGLGWGRDAVIAISAISLLMPLVLWYFIARRASAFAKWLLVLLPVAAGRPWASTAIWLVKLVVGRCLEACPRWYSGKPSAAMWLLELAGHVAVVQHGHAKRSWTALLG